MTAAIVGVYLLAMLGIGFYLSKRVRSASDFLVAGRKLGLVLTTATVAAVQIGAGVILGGAELGAEAGVWPGMWYGMGSSSSKNVKPGPASKNLRGCQ